MLQLVVDKDLRLGIHIDIKNWLALANFLRYMVKYTQKN